MEERRCAGCGEPLELNHRSRGTHRWCRRPECQRARKAQTQRERRACAEAPTKATRRQRAAYMHAYRAEHPEYRAREARARRERRRAGGRAGDGTARRNEAGSTELAQAIYVDAGQDGARRLRVVTEAGSVLTLALTGLAGRLEVARRNEAG
jgi:hypothetical protein